MPDNQYDLRPPEQCNHVAAFNLTEWIRWCPSCGAIYQKAKEQWDNPTTMFYRPPQGWLSSSLAIDPAVLIRLTFEEYEKCAAEIGVTDLGPFDGNPLKAWHGLFYWMSEKLENLKRGHSSHRNLH